MSTNRQSADPYMGMTLGDYTLTERIGKGTIGTVYRAERANPSHVVACKIIPQAKLKDGWQSELSKVVRLTGVPHVVQYIDHGTDLDRENQTFVWIFWQYIPGRNLGEYLKAPPSPLDMAFVEQIAATLLRVLYACGREDIRHGDLHDGNVLISEPDEHLIGTPRRIFVSDFGCGGSHNDVEPRDDYRQCFSIVMSLLRRLRPADLNSRDRLLHEKLSQSLGKRLLEADATQGRYVRDAAALLEEIQGLVRSAAIEAAAGAASAGTRAPGDYLVAEALGYRAEEWKELFVPDFLAAEELLSKNVTVLTGARGCGKTMTFRRLTRFMDEVIGEPCRVEGADRFIGFYLNCRDLIEAFPWLPRSLSVGTQQQLIHYFHLAWLSEICKTLAVSDPERDGDYSWLDSFMRGVFGKAYQSLPAGGDALSHVQAYLENDKERCRLTRLGSARGPAAWPLSRVDLLDAVQGLVEQNLPWATGVPFYLFLDDYTIPIVPRQLQNVLNQLVFKRRSDLFFKISTEAINSFSREGVRGKPLELHQDFELLDLATASLHQGRKEKGDLLDKIFRPRIDRHSILKAKDLGLQDVLGDTPYSQNQLAKRLRHAAAKERSRVLYHGRGIFVGMWASDIRTMIQMFVEMLRDANGELKKGESTVIPREIQDKCYRTTGGEFLSFAEAVVDPSTLEKSPAGQDRSYGKHLRRIAEEFINVARYELTRGLEVSNQGRRNPRQAFRIEVLDRVDIPDDVLHYYEGLIRWHLFLQDWRGKSVRGLITARLYLNRILLPVARLTVSSHDNISLTNDEFVDLLREPDGFEERYRKGERRRRRQLRSQQRPLALSSGAEEGKR